MQIRRRKPVTQTRLPDSLPPLLRRIYLNRGIQTQSELDLSLSSLLKPGDIKGMDQAVDLLVEAYDGGEHILVVGDYDADGATATALLIDVLNQMGFDRVSYMVPDRFRLGYGLTPEIVSLAADNQPDLIITVDNGISSISGVQAARRSGIKVLVTDHHLPGDTLPDANAIVNPNQPGCNFESKALAGVGVAFYLMVALRARLRDRGVGSLPNLAASLDLVALGTVADMVPLDHNNRILVHQGLSRIRAGLARPGIQALVDVSGRDGSRLSAADLGFALGPRLNAAGRLEDMSAGIACLVSDSADTALTFARQLDALNQTRRELQQDMQTEADNIVEKLRHKLSGRLPAGICLFDHSWHQGIVGLVAGRLKDSIHRPVVAFAPEEDGSEVLKGSGRSIPGMHMRDALDTIAARNPGLVEKFGGHAMAAGLSLRRDALEDFGAALESIATEWLTADDLSPFRLSDGELDENDINLDTARMLEQGGPWGQGFDEPLFDGIFGVEKYRIIGDNHLKLTLSTDNGTVEGIYFNSPVINPGSTVEVLYRLTVNHYNGRETPQLVITHMDETM